jgi:hypothetical protein
MMPKRPKLPKEFPNEWAREAYIYHVVGRGLPHVFYKEFEDRKKAGREVAFRFHDIVMFFAAAAASGVIGNFTYAAILRAIKAIRKPKQEIGGADIRFDAVVSRKTYNRVRREKHSGKRGRQVSTFELEEKLQTEYRLMVHIKQPNRK